MINQPTNNKENKKTKNKDNKNNKRITHEKHPLQNPRRRWGVRPCARAQLGAQSKVYFHKQPKNQGQWKQQEDTKTKILEQ